MALAGKSKASVEEERSQQSVLDEFLSLVDGGHSPLPGNKSLDGVGLLGKAVAQLANGPELSPKPVVPSLDLSKVTLELQGQSVR